MGNGNVVEVELGGHNSDEPQEEVGGHVNDGMCMAGDDDDVSSHQPNHTIRFCPFRSWERPPWRQEHEMQVPPVHRNLRVPHAVEPLGMKEEEGIVIPHSAPPCC